MLRIYMPIHRSIAPNASDPAQLSTARETFCPLRENNKTHTPEHSGASATKQAPSCTSDSFMGRPDRPATASLTPIINLIMTAHGTLNSISTTATPWNHVSFVLYMVILCALTQWHRYHHGHQKP